MTKREHLQFLVLMIPTFLVLAAAAVSMADLAFPASGVPEEAVRVAVSAPLRPADLPWEYSPIE